MKKKTWILLILGLVALLAFTSACSDEPDEPEEPAAETETEAEEPMAEAALREYIEKKLLTRSGKEEALKVLLI